ncbi:MAG: hypothetical protein MUC37_12480 [Hyphomicrobium sp.]|jgi:hypothetical protein|nr:hypothetical protein [Hyphomicrobium sp.]
MDDAEINRLSKLQYYDPLYALPELRKVQLAISELQNIPNSIRNLRTRKLKRERELWMAFLLAYGLRARTGLPLLLADDEESDHDVVLATVANDLPHFLPVQLKEVVPEDLNPTANVQNIIDDTFAKRSYQDTLLAIKITQNYSFDPNGLVVPPFSFAGIWIFAAVSPDQSRWALWGDFIDDRLGTIFEIP